MPVQQRFSRIDSALAERLYRDANAEPMAPAQAAFTAALETSCAKAFAGAEPGPRERERYLASLHLEDLALACACALGDTQPGITSCSRCARRSTVRQTRSIDREARASWPTRSMRTFMAWSSATGSASRCSVTFTAAAVSPPGCAPFLRSVMSIACASSGVLSRLPEDLPAKTAPTARDPDCARFVELLRTGLETVMAALDPRDRFDSGATTRSS